MDERNDQVIESLRIAVVQIPFIPIICNPDFNSLYEPDGGINNWWFAEDLENGINFNDLNLEEKYRSKIESYFTNEYFLWLEKTLKQILEHMEYEKHIDLIVFPEYSLPIEVNKNIQEMIIEYSKDTCIVAGIGSVNNLNGDPRKNKFVVAQDGELTYCEKIHPNTTEVDLGIVGGTGPIIHNLIVKREKGNILIPFAVLMCSDDIARTGVGNPIHEYIKKELDEIQLNHEDIELYIVPSFSLNTSEFEKLSIIDAIRGPNIVAFVNGSQFGNSCVYHPIISKSDNISSEKLQKNEVGYIIAEIKTFIKAIPRTTPIIKKLNLPKTDCKSVIFKSKYEECNFNDIRLETPSIHQLISERLSFAIEICGIYLKRSFLGSENKGLEYLIKLKKLQEKISSQFLGNNPNFYNFSAWDYLTFISLEENENFYLLLLNNIKDQSSDQKIKDMVSKLIELISEKNLSVPAYWK